MFSTLTSRILYSTLMSALAALLLYLISLNTSLQLQSLTTWSLVLFLYLFKKHRLSETLTGRLLFLLIVSFISLRYMYWRTFDTLTYINFIEFLFMALLYIAELQVMAVHFMGMFANVWPFNRKKAPPLPDDPDALPSVDIFIPTYNEPEEIAEITAIACQQLRYPKDKLHIHILDDGSTIKKRSDKQLGSVAWNRYDELQRFCDRLGLNYITRKENDHAKAGNLNHALTVTSAELVLILDCDHVPTADFLENTVGYFLHDPKLFLVQTPHFFINPDPVEKNLHSYHTAPSENELFYRANHPGINLWNSSFFCGSAGLLRRTALEEIGGLAGDTITEDAEVSLELHARGWHSMYQGKPLICGLSPENFSDFLVQRGRWCQGMLQMAFLKNPLFRAGLSFAQRVCYSSFYLYWFFGFARFLFFVAPTLFLLFNLRIYHASSIEVAAFALPHLVTSFLVTDYLFGKYRWPFFSELYESVQSIFLLGPAMSVIADPHQPQFMVTPKGTHLDHDYLNPLAIPFYIMFTIMIAAYPMAVYKWIEQPAYQDVIVLCTAWLTVNVIIALASLGAFWERHQVRHHHRAWAEGPVTITLEDGSFPLRGELTDISLSGVGFKAEQQSTYRLKQEVKITIEDSYGQQHCLPACIMRLSQAGDHYAFGLEFSCQQQNLRQRVALVYGDSQRWADFWKRPSKHPGLFYIMYFLVRMGISGTRQSLIGKAKLLSMVYRSIIKHVKSTP